MSLADVGIYVSACFVCFATGFVGGLWHKWTIKLAKASASF